MGESIGSITISVSVMGNTLRRPVEVIFSTRDGSATSTDPRDYENIGDVFLQFDETIDRHTFNIPIHDDTILENIEIFFGQLRSSCSAVDLNPAETQIEIYDIEEGKGRSNIYSVLVHERSTNDS